MDPETSRLPSLMSAFRPDADALLNALRRVVSDEDITAISDADYGEDAAEHFERLVAIRDGGEVPYPLDWCPKEVCELTRVVPPSVFRRPDLRPEHSGDRDSARRCAFASAILLRSAMDDSDGYSMAEDSTAAAIISCVLILGDPFIEYAVQALAALIASPNCATGSRPAIALAMVICQLQAPASLGVGAAIVDVCNAIVEDADDYRDRVGLASETWVNGLDLLAQYELWKAFARFLLVYPDREHPAEAQEILTQIGIHIMDQPSLE